MTISEWYVSDQLDWSRRRNKIKPLFYTIANTDLSNYANLTGEEKLIGAILFLVPYSLRVENTLVTEIQDKDNWTYLLQKTKESRVSCVESIRLAIGQHIRTGKITLTNSQKFFDDAYILTEMFKESNSPMFKKWLINEEGSKYEFGGFRNTAYWSQLLQDELMLIYEGGYI